MQSVNRKTIIKQKALIQKLRSPSIYAFLGLFILLFLYYFHPIPLQGPNVDLGYHLALGKFIVEEKFIPSTNIFSYTASGFQYINTAWLSDVFFYLWYKLTGFTGLILLSVFLIITTFSLLFTSVEVKNRFAAFIIFLIYVQLLIERTEVKPELFSLLLLSIFLFVLYKYRLKYTRWIFLLPLLEILWVNLHIYFIIGPAVTGLFLIDVAISKKGKNIPKKVYVLAGVTLTTGLATLANPQFLSGALYPFTVFNNYGYNVIENYNFFAAFTSQQSYTFYYFSIAVLLLWLILLIAWKGLKIVDILLVCFFTFLAFFAVRNFPLFVIGTFIPAVIGLQNISLSLVKKYRPVLTQRITWVIVMTIILAISPAFVWTLSVHGFGTGAIDDAKKGVDLLQKNNISGPIYNNYNIGNYLVYRLFPKEKIFVHGSPEAYPKEFFANVYYPVETTYEAFVKESNRYKFNVVLYDHVNQTTNTNSLLANIIKSNDWKLVYLNNRIVIFVKNSPKNQIFFSSYLLTENNLQLKEKDIDTKEELQIFSNVFRVFGWYEKMFEMDMKYLSYDPNNCIALRHVVFYMSHTNHPLTHSYRDKFQQKCSR